jgi:hypothetical protein
LIVVNSYVDFEDYSSPVKRYLDDKYSWRGKPDSTKLIRMFPKENSVELRDNIVGISSSEYQNFISINEAMLDITNLNTFGDYFDITINLSSEKTNYQRSVFTLFDLTGLIGGLFEVLTMLFGLLVTYLSKHSFYHSIFKRLYHIENKSGENRNKVEFSYNNKRRVHIEKIEESKQEITHNDESSIVGINKKEVS